jgi:hypothetical protein
MRSKKMKWEKHVASMDHMRNANKILAWKSEAKQHMENLRRVRDKIKIDLKEIKYKLG